MNATTGATIAWLDVDDDGPICPKCFRPMGDARERVDARGAGIDNGEATVVVCRPCHHRYRLRAVRATSTN